jgi:DNA repair exonuclease SbcCD nuclease subunit
VAASSCRHVVIVAGNHDSPSFLNAPKELLKALHVHVVGSAASSLEDEVLVLRDERGAPELIVCAVPYLRDRDIRVAEAGESVVNDASSFMMCLMTSGRNCAAPPRKRSLFSLRTMCWQNKEVVYENTASTLQKY